MVGFASLAGLYVYGPYFSKILLDIKIDIHGDFTIHDGFLFKDIQLYISYCSLRLQIIQELYSERHVGQDCILQSVITSCQDNDAIFGKMSYLRTSQEASFKRRSLFTSSYFDTTDDGHNLSTFDTG